MLRNDEIDELALARFRIRKIRRTAVEASKHLSHSPKIHPKAAEIGRMGRACDSVIVATRPSVVSKANFGDCMALLAFTIAATTCKPRNQN
jgi:hypothetical protein